MIGLVSHGMLPRKKYPPAQLRAFRGTEIGGIGVYVEDHVESFVSDFCIRVCPHVVEDLVNTIKCLFGGGTLLCGDC